MCTFFLGQVGVVRERRNFTRWVPAHPGMAMYAKKRGTEHAGISGLLQDVMCTYF